VFLKKVRRGRKTERLRGDGSEEKRIFRKAAAVMINPELTGER